MKPQFALLLVIFLLSGCSDDKPQSPVDRQVPVNGQKPLEQGSLTDARKGFKTRLVRQEAEKEPAARPPARLFRTVRYDSPVGKLAAYLSVTPTDGKKHPAIIWVFGGFSNGIGATAWEKAPANNDQSASAFRQAGIITMYPSLRGGNDNPGFKEGFFGEVEDVLAAADFLIKQDGVDPKRIYLGGHSTGGTLVLLVAACSNRFRAVFSFGPADDVRGYGDKSLPFDTSNPKELLLRAPNRWLHSIQSPVFVFEGTDENGNLASLQSLSRASRNPLVHCHPVPGADHFSILAPMNRLLAAKVLDDEGGKTNLAFSQMELSSVMRK